MHYMGSKARHADDILGIMLPRRRPDQWYVEPFVGGGNVICKVPQGIGRVANDKNFGMTALLDALGNRGWVPPEEVTHADWKRILKQDINKLDQDGQALFALVATGLCFGSKWCDTYVKEPGRWRQTRTAALEDAPGLKGIAFHNGDYDQFPIPAESMVYCDPPYASTAEYCGAVRPVLVGQSDHNVWKPSKFWKWADALVDSGRDVFVSEYSGPPASLYGKVWTTELKSEHTAECAKCRALQADTNSATADIDASQSRIRDLESQALDEGRRLADRWKVLWTREVTSDFSPTRGEDAGEHKAKREVECLFHRE